MVAVDRSSPRHTLVDLDASSSLRGHLAAAHTAGDNVLMADNQENTLIEGAVRRDDVPPGEVPRLGTKGFC